MEVILFVIALLVLLNSLATAALLMKSRNSGLSKHVYSIVVDTSGLIDGRLVDVIAAGFVHGRVIIPKIVIGELQHLADMADPHKRERARFGLDIVKQIQDHPHTNVVIAPEETPGEPVDDQLISLAKRYSAALYTTDYNLNKVATIKGVRVLNVNELAQGLRSSALPGEKALIKIIQKGQDASQGVGYLDDGTMVVVERAGTRLNQTVEVNFSRVLQTQAGKMLFAKLVNQAPSSKQPKPATPKPPSSTSTQSNNEQTTHHHKRPAQKKHTSSPNKRYSSRQSVENSLLETVKRLEK